MNINEMTRKQFKELPIIKDDINNFNSIVLLPTKLEHDSGFNYYSIIPCLNEEAVGRLQAYDTFQISNFLSSKVGRYSFWIDCLRTSSLMRIFFSRNKYTICPYIHQMDEKE